MSNWGEMRRRSAGKKVRREDLPEISFSNALTITDKEKEAIEKPILDLYESSRVYPISEQKGWQVKDVFISEKKKTLLLVFQERAKEEKRDKSEDEKLAMISVLGEYVSSEKKIILYINNMKDITSKAPVGTYGNLLTILRYVYLHEMMHAYFDRNAGHQYVYGIEEPFAEFGALLGLKELVSNKKAEANELDWALSHVERKTGVIRCYSYGATLFNNYNGKEALAKEMLKSYL